MISDVRRYLQIRQELMGLEHKFASIGLAGARKPLNVDDLILQWNAFTPDVLADDRTLVQDYLHYLMVRDHLERFIAAATPDTRGYLESLIAPRDAAFREATVPNDPGLVGVFPGASDNWWWRVTPRRLGRELHRQISGPDRID